MSVGSVSNNTMGVDLSSKTEKQASTRSSGAGNVPDPPAPTPQSTADKVTLSPEAKALSSGAGNVPTPP